MPSSPGTGRRTWRGPIPRRRPCRWTGWILGPHQLIIIITGQQGARALAELAGSRESATLISPTTTAHFPALTKDALPVKDPKHGWIIPITPSLASALSQAEIAGAPLADAPISGEYELSPSLAVVVE